jgi:hypothetical protein
VFQVSPDDGVDCAVAVESGSIRSVFFCARLQSGPCLVDPSTSELNRCQFPAVATLRAGANLSLFLCAQLEGLEGKRIRKRFSLPSVVTNNL